MSLWFEVGSSLYEGTEPSCTCTCTFIIYPCTCTSCNKTFNGLFLSVCLISSYGTPLAQRASYLGLHSSLFGPDGAVNYDYIITNSINWLNGTHTNHC